ncbi:MAG: histidinol-phosphate transaminase [Candidatus Bathyarchaeota archaeon]|nr:histidinol-phosphate transaminase [Candidatus Bathyarchaeota archaeon]
MRTKGNLDWLEKKLGVARSFDGSLLKYVGASPKVEELADELKMDVSEVLKLDSNENFFVDNDFLHGIASEVLKEIDLRLYDSRVIVGVKEALGEYLGVKPECITVSSGSEQLIDLIAHLFLEKGDNAVVAVPSFFIYEKRVKLKGATLFAVPLKADLSLDVEAILDKVNSRTRLVFICSPNNPTANQFEWDQVEAVADGCSSLIVLDEAYAEFADYSAASSAVSKDNIVVLRTFSKAFALAGLRFGYAVSNEDLASFLSEVMPYTVNTFTAKFVSKMLSCVDVIEASAGKVKEERERLVEGFRAIDGIEVFESKTNFVTFKPMKGAERIYSELLKKGIIVKNLGNLPVIGHCLRVTVGLPGMNDRFLKTLSEILDMAS